MMDDNFRVKTFAFGSGRSKKSSGSPSGWWIDQDDDQGYIMQPQIEHWSKRGNYELNFENFEPPLPF